MNEERHEMHRVQHFSTGAEEWECRECGRRFIMLLAPNFQKMVLNQGNENAIHIGGTAGIALSLIQADQEKDDLHGADLEPVNRWFKAINFESLWNKN